MDRAGLLWTAAIVAAVLAVPLVFANALATPMHGRNEELGALLFLLAALLAITGAVVRGWRTRAGKVGLALGLAVPLLMVGFVAYAIATVPRLPYTVIEWKRMPDGTTGPEVPASAFTAAARDALGRALSGEKGCAYFDTQARWEAFERAKLAAYPNATDHFAPVVLVLDGKAFEFGRGADPEPCAIP